MFKTNKKEEVKPKTKMKTLGKEELSILIVKRVQGNELFSNELIADYLTTEKIISFVNQVDYRVIRGSDLRKEELSKANKVLYDMILAAFRDISRNATHKVHFSDGTVEGFTGEYNAEVMEASMVGAGDTTHAKLRQLDYARIGDATINMSQVKYIERSPVISQLLSLKSAIRAELSVSPWI